MPGPFYHKNDVNVYLGRQNVGGVLIERMDFVHVFFVLKQERYVFRLVNIQNSSTWGKNYKKASSSFFQWGTPSPPLFTKVDKMSFM